VAWLTAYPYLGFSLLLLAVAGLGFAAWQAAPVPQRHAGRLLMFVGAVTCTPFGLFSYMYIPKYWRPVLTCWLGCASPEDLLFASATAGIAVGLGLAPYARRLELPAVDGRRFLLRLALFCATGISLGFGLLYAVGWRIDTMLACLIATAAATALVFVRRPDLWRVSLPGLLFVPFYWLSLHVAFILWPSFSAAWTRAATHHLLIGGVPLYELLWGSGLGIAWPALMGWCSGLRLRPPAGQ
jgi:hypothetical protein